MNKYRVKGSVMQFGSCIGSVTRETMATTESKAKSNCLAQIKRELNLLYSTNLSWGKDTTVTVIG